MPIVTAFQWSYNPFYRAIEECLGREVNDVPDLGCLHGFRMKRVWGGITTRNSQLIKEF